MDYKLGKLPAKHDSRTLKMVQILKPLFLPPIPPEYDFDQNFQVPTPMYANDRFGDCVIAGRAHQTLRFEAVEQRKIIPISEEDVTKEYFAESGGRDAGLIVLDSLKLWRNQGWAAAGNTFSISAFAAIDPKNHQEVRAAIYLLTGVGTGLALPWLAEHQFRRGDIWDVPRWYDWGNKGIMGGHYVFISGYNKTGPVGVTWGRKQQMTWRFWDKYCDECYGIVDNKDCWIPDSPIDCKKLEEYLNQVCG